MTPPPPETILDTAHSPAATLFWGVVLLVLFFFYLGTIDQKKKKIAGTILTVVMSFFCIWAFNGLNIFKGKPISVPLGIDLAGGSSFTVELSPATDNSGKEIKPSRSDVQHAIDVLEHSSVPMEKKICSCCPRATGGSRS